MKVATLILNRNLPKINRNLPKCTRNLSKCSTVDIYYNLQFGDFFNQ